MKDTEENGFAQITPFFAHVISCPGVRHPTLRDGRMTQMDIDRLRVKIETILQLAERENVATLVLGALGCGAWKNPAIDVACAFKEALDRFAGVFRRVVFAVKPPAKDMYMGQPAPCRDAVASDSALRFAPWGTERPGASNTVQDGNFETFRSVLSGDPGESAA